MDKRFKYPVMGYLATVFGIAFIIAVWGLQYNSIIKTTTAVMITLFIIGTMQYIKEDTNKSRQ